MYINHSVDSKYSKYTHSEVNKCSFRSQRKQETADLHPQVEMRRIIANFGRLVLHCCWTCGAHVVHPNTRSPTKLESGSSCSSRPTRLTSDAWRRSTPSPRRINHSILSWGRHTVFECVFKGNSVEKSPNCLYFSIIENMQLFRWNA